MSIPVAKNIGRPVMNVVRFKGLPILQQLNIEEQLLRTSSDNWLIINDGTNDPTIVMGVSGKPAELLQIETVLKDKIPVIRRYSGGGTVIVDQGTIFVSFICGKDAVPGLTLYPHPIMTWSGGLYDEVFKGVGNFRLRENDYVFDDRKFGGNAQSITKTRWVHHTSFLWDFKVANMSYLKLPKRIPKYRLARNHLDFICCMKDFMSRSDFVERTVQATGSQFTVQSAGLEAIEALSNTKFSPSSKILTKQDLQAALVTA